MARQRGRSRYRSGGIAADDVGVEQGPDDRGDVSPSNGSSALLAAIRCGAQVIVTNNVSDFPAGQLDEYGIEAQTADEFLVHLVDLRSALVAATLQRQADSLRDPPQTLNEVLARLERSGLTRTVAELRLHLKP